MHNITRRYVAIVKGIIDKDNIKIDLPIGRSESDRIKMAVTKKNSKNAVTHFNVLKHLNNATYVSCILETGRTHQIRVHMQYIGHSILGDPVYTLKNPYNLAGQALHARVIGFNHPATGEYMEFTKEPPQYFFDLLEKLSPQEI